MLGCLEVCNSLVPRWWLCGCWWRGEFVDLGFLEDLHCLRCLCFWIKRNIKSLYQEINAIRLWMHRVLVQHVYGVHMGDHQVYFHCVCILPLIEMYFPFSWQNKTSQNESLTFSINFFSLVNLVVTRFLLFLSELFVFTGGKKAEAWIATGRFFKCKTFFTCCGGEKGIGLFE